VDGFLFLVLVGCVLYLGGVLCVGLWDLLRRVSGRATVWKFALVRRLVRQE
jgi:hypothetical protein